jgi:hypothetical protein
MNASDTNMPVKIIGLTFMVFEGDIVRDDNGNITNKLRETMHYEAPEIERNGASVRSKNEIIAATLAGE